ncbi:type I-C CRISPR-associated protein Cas8c/Csd1 [uncultured Paracoccus sp.]|uniref:type I-C CRISPR-associated protein Cas8c/Csd1 n=1 Tax=uncultured Paracoccus sp. TaxID=189685 RepID=UPI002592DDF1|nr:type I-C CRISPR-associated protein Cas8c/Csd1 [uncultured Paracoccus sp.]
MSMLASLVRAYDRLPDAPPFGFSTEKIGFCVLLNADGSVASVEDLRGDDRKRSPRMLLVPQPWKKASGIKPNFLWENSAYAFGVTAGDRRRTVQEHASFREKHLEWLADAEDDGLLALRKFVESWNPETFQSFSKASELLDQRFIFALADRYLEGFIHDRPEARRLWQGILSKEALQSTICLVTGTVAPVARLHPSIKGVWGAQPSGASLVSFNDDAYESYGHKQGDNAPVSEAAAFAYGTVLNRYLDKDSGHRIQIGDASTVFWADCSDMKLATEAEVFFAALLDPASEERLVAEDEKLETAKIHSRLDAIRNGQRLLRVAPDLAEGVRFHVLGLAPNAARLSVRFYWQDDFGRLTANFQRYLEDTAIDPPPRDGWPPLWRYLLELASQGKRENVPPLIAGEWLRAILTGTAYPLTLLSTALMRMRADGEINALRCAMLKSVLIRNLKMEAPVALDPANTNKGYILGRLFAVYEEVQRAALGGINATIKDKFYGAASARPQKVFRTLDSGSANHFGKLRKTSPGRAVNLEKLLTSITDLMDPAGDPIPASLNAAEQALFGIGYYHQRSDFFRKHDDKTPEVSQ